MRLRSVGKDLNQLLSHGQRCDLAPLSARTKEFVVCMLLFFASS